MPLQLPNLDDRRYADLVEEARGLIPTYAPEWTNHNPSDPGITLVELFAFLSEMLIYRLNRVTSANVLSFLKLLNGPAWNPLGKDPDQLTPEEIAAEAPRTILQLRKLDRAVSSADFEALTLELEAGARVARVKCLPRLDFERNPDREKAGHVTVTILPKANPEPDLPGLITAVNDYLTPRLLLTTRLHVIGPQFLTVGITATVVPLPDAEAAPLKQAVVDAVKKFLHPLSGGDDADGWPFGRNVFISEIFSLIDQLPGVDYVTAVDLTSPTPGRPIKNAATELVGIEVRPYELVTAQMATTDVTVQAL
jgi:Baseplate J-like protein